MKLAFTLLLMGIAQSQTLLNTLRNLGASDSSYEDGTSLGPGTTDIHYLAYDEEEYKKLDAQNAQANNAIDAKAHEDIKAIEFKIIQDVVDIYAKADEKKKAIYAEAFEQKKAMDAETATKKKEINHPKSLQQLLQQEPKGIPGFTPTEHTINVFKKIGGLNYQKLVDDNIVEQPSQPVTIKLNFEEPAYDYNYFEFAQVNSDDQLHGFARYISKSGQVIESEFRNGQDHGFKRYISYENNSKYSDNYTIYWLQNQWSNIDKKFYSQRLGYINYSNGSNTPNYEKYQNSLNAKGKEAFTKIKKNGAEYYFTKY